MCRSLTIYAAAALLLFIFAAGAADYGSQEALAYEGPPVAQPLVREGDFAVRLAARYGLGVPEQETEAEDLLAAAGVVPLNGWISDYPVTPDILGQLQDSAARSASEGRLPMTAEQATQLIAELASEMNLPLPAGPAPGQQAPVRPYEETVVNNYYAGYGPPVITYYPPPLSYLYLYAWVPYPAWWYGSWYPGFYIFHDFSTTIAVGAKRVFVRNRFVDPVTRQVVRIDPVVRSSGDTVRALTTLRTNDGRTYRNIREMRQSVGRGRPPLDRDGTISRVPPGTGGVRKFEQGDNRRTGPVGRGDIRRDENRKAPGGISGLPQRQDRQQQYDRRPPGETKQSIAPQAGRPAVPPRKFEKPRVNRPTPGSEARPAPPGPYDRPPARGRWLDSTPKRPLGEGALKHGGPRTLPGPGWGNDRPGQRR